MRSLPSRDEHRNCPVSIRNFDPNDLDAITRLESNAFDPRDADSRETIESTAARYPDGFLVAKDGDTVVGYLMSGPRRAHGYIQSVAVAEDWRSEGIGRLG